mmetsp:Transcript_6418/g.12132  ORF Transcript_6418/g.12132 Transcript_6418/m.12132 type:complete len:264 (+) Transcript_6418:258-1049(+)
MEKVHILVHRLSVVAQEHLDVVFCHNLRLDGKDKDLHKLPPFHPGLRVRIVGELLHKLKECLVSKHRIRKSPVQNLSGKLVGVLRFFVTHVTQNILEDLESQRLHLSFPITRNLLRQILQAAVDGNLGPFEHALSKLFFAESKEFLICPTDRIHQLRILLEGEHCSALEENDIFQLDLSPDSALFVVQLIRCLQLLLDEGLFGSVVQQLANFFDWWSHVINCLGSLHHIQHNRLVKCHHAVSCIFIQGLSVSEGLEIHLSDLL